MMNRLPIIDDTRKVCFSSEEDSWIEEINGKLE
jgi:hypothetical protein